MEYTEIKYVDVINGEDIIENGTESNPYHTISYCVSQLSTTNPLVYISSGSYTIDNILTLKVVGKTITYIGTGRDTIININNGISANQEGKFIIFSCVLTPSETSTMSYIIGRDNYSYGTKDVKDWYYFQGITIGFRLGTGSGGGGSLFNRSKGGKQLDCPRNVY